MSSTRSSIAALLVSALLSIAATCEGPRPIDLDFDDRGQTTPGGRATYEILPGNDTRRRGSLLDLVAGAAPLTGVEAEPPEQDIIATLAVVAEYASTNGHGSEPVPAGREIDFDVELAGPTTVGIDVDNQRGFVAFRPGVRALDMFSVEALLGVGIDHTRVRVQNAGFLQTDEDVSPGLLLGLRLGFRPIPLIDFYAQASTTAGHSGTTDLEAGGQLNLTKNVGVYGGYRRFRYADEKAKGNGSDLEFDFRGPTFGLSLTF
ncbi:MAG: hypothetical protein NXI30_11440 [bacterium]|nr:hypothetical protein [bacterium]